MLCDHAVLTDVHSMHEAEQVGHPTLWTLAESHLSHHTTRDYHMKNELVT